MKTNHSVPTLIGAFVLAGLLLGLDGNQSATAAERTPNIVLILADDVGSEALGSYGGTSYPTPNLDRLAKTGMRFTHAYSMPVCHPTRICLMTGRYPFRFGSTWGTFPEGATTFAHLLQQAGYATAVAGKWQLVLQQENPDHPAELGFDESCLFGWHEGPRYHQPYLWQNGQRRLDAEKPNVFGPDVYCEFLIDFMKQNRDRPFLAYYPMALCHEISDDFSPPPPPGPDGKYLNYGQMIETMDAIVGRLVAAIEQLGLRERTVVLFATDNGSPQSYLTDLEIRGSQVIRHHAPVISLRDGRPVHGGKGTLTDAGTRVPLIANWLGTIREGQVVDDLVDFSDILPTLIDLAGESAPEHLSLDGVSFAARLRGTAESPRKWAFCEQGDRYWVRNRDWKLYNDGSLFDMRNDPDEKNSISPQQETDAAQVARQQLQAAAQSMGVTQLSSFPQPDSGPR